MAHDVGDVGTVGDATKVVPGVRQEESGQRNALRRRLWSWLLLWETLHVVTELQGCMRSARVSRP